MVFLLQNEIQVRDVTTGRFNLDSWARHVCARPDLGRLSPTTAPMLKCRAIEIGSQALDTGKFPLLFLIDSHRHKILLREQDWRALSEIFPAICGKYIQPYVQTPFSHTIAVQRGAVLTTGGWKLFYTTGPDYIATEMLALPSKSSRNKNDSDLMIAIPWMGRQLLYKVKWA